MQVGEEFTKAVELTTFSREKKDNAVDHRERTTAASVTTGRLAVMQEKCQVPLRELNGDNTTVVGMVNGWAQHGTVVFNAPQCMFLSVEEEE